ncbi:MAG: dTMP kinase [Thermodesulfobacteriota bacterium]|nr:dTMP kinase [Thermodesulfobacteriota bacterium]
MSQLEKGILLAFEGIDGSGKTTQAKILYDTLRSKGYATVLTKEPTDGKWGRMIREVITGGRGEISPEEELALFINDRKEHVEREVKPALLQKSIIVVDRYYFSTMAYQGALCLDVEKIRLENELFAPIPDIVFILDVEVDMGIGRIVYNRKNGLDTFEQREYLERVRKIFREMSAPYIQLIDATLSPTEVSQNIEKITMSYIHYI